MGMHKGNYIENEGAYQAAIERRIKANRAKTGRAKWFAAHADAQELHDWLFAVGQYDDMDFRDPRCDGIHDDCKCGVKAHPLTWYAGGEFYNKLRGAIHEWGGLTDKQTEVVRNGLAKAKQRLAERDAQRAADKAQLAATSKHIGAVGDRMVFDLVVDRSLKFVGEWGSTFINICHDAAGNVIVYKGTAGWKKGPRKVKATVKKHDVRDGIAQTFISRPVDL